MAPPRVITVTPPGAITAALESARAGDAVRVTRGSYSESIHLKRAVDLIAAPPGEAIILGPVYADGVGQSRLEGFQIRAGDFGVAIHDSDIVVTRCDISGARTAGVKISGDSRGAIVACSIHENIGPGILIADAASPTIENNAIWNNGLDPAFWSVRRCIPALFATFFRAMARKPSGSPRRTTASSKATSSSRPQDRIANPKSASCR